MLRCRSAHAAAKPCYVRTWQKTTITTATTTAATAVLVHKKCQPKKTCENHTMC